MSWINLTHTFLDADKYKVDFLQGLFIMKLANIVLPLTISFLLNSCNDSSIKGVDVQICGPSTDLDPKNSIALPFVLKYEDKDHDIFAGYFPSLKSCNLALNLLKNHNGSKVSCLAILEMNPRYKYQHFFKCNTVTSMFEL